MSGSASLGQCAPRSAAVCPHHAPWTAKLACNPRRRILLSQLIVPQIWVHKDDVLVSWFPSTYFRARCAWEKFVSASPSHPGIREDHLPTSPVMYFRESCSFSKRTAFRPASVVRLKIVQQCSWYVVLRCRYTNGSRSQWSVSLMCLYQGQAGLRTPISSPR